VYVTSALRGHTVGLLRVRSIVAVRFYRLMLGTFREGDGKTVGLVPSQRHALVAESAFRFNYTTILNFVFLALSALLLLRFFRTGGPKMLRMMKIPVTVSATAPTP
jgi:hypothetical protein